MLSNVVSGIAALPGWNISLLLLLVKATIILVAALGITLSMQRASAGARHLVWLVALGTLFLVPVLAVWAPLRLAILPAPTVTEAFGDAVGPGPKRAAAGSSVFSTSQATADDALVGLSVPGHSQSATDNHLRSRIESMSGISILASIWATVVLAIAATLAWAGRAVRRIVRRATPLTAPDWVNPLFEIADRLGLDEAPRLVKSDVAKMPFACGVLTPTIVLPAEAETWTLARRRAVLLHELAHVRRHDLLGHTLGRVACAVYWFHPLVWTAAKKLRNESERACDDLALSCGTRATDYAEHLLDIVTSVRGDSTPLVALAMARRKEFEGRMLAILDPELRRGALSRKQSAALAGTLALLSLTVAAVAPVQRTAIVATQPRMAQHDTPREMAQKPSVQMRVNNAYPDSGERGVMTVVTGKSTSTRTATITSQSMSRSSARPAPHVVSHPSPIPHGGGGGGGGGGSVLRVESTSDVINSAAEEIRKSGEIAIAELAKAGVRIGLSAASSALEEFGRSTMDAKGTRTGNGVGDKGDKGGKGAKGSKNPDDRPALLAKVLRTDSSASLRRIAAWGLQEYAEAPVAAAALALALKRDSDANVREMCAWALGSGDNGLSASLSALASALRNDASEKVRAISAWSLGTIGDRSAMDALTSALGDASADVRLRAVWAIGNVEPKQAPRALLGLLNDKEPKVREVTAWALFQIADASTAPAIEVALKTEQNKDVQLGLVRAIAAMGEKSVDALRGLLESPDPRVKAMAVRALAGGNATGPWPRPQPMPRPFP